MKIAVLFDGAGLARLGLEQAGHECIGVELNPIAHHLSKFVGSGNCILGDAKDFDLSEFQACWASPPCQAHSRVITKRGLETKTKFGESGLLQWALREIKTEVSWIENVDNGRKYKHQFGPRYNAAQFTKEPRQQRTRIIGGNHNPPKVFREYKSRFPGVCPSIMAGEWHGTGQRGRRYLPSGYSRNKEVGASRFYGRRLTERECAYHQGFEIPKEWLTIPDFFFEMNPGKWRHIETLWKREIYKAIGNGVPVYMAKAFGRAHR